MYNNYRVVVSYTDDAWGNPLTTTGILADTIGAHNPLRYRGYVYDTETGFYYLQSRYYDPTIGRFVNGDELVDNGAGILGNNMFAYCINNPINMIDVCGQIPKYINDQRDDYVIDGKQMKDISFGFGNISDYGCGVIAAYNVLLSKSSKVTFNRVKNDIIRRGGLNFGGLLGTNPNALVNYMRSKFWFVFTAGPITYLWGLKAELSEAVIILIMWKEYPGMHYMAGISTGNSGSGGRFKFYNTGLSDSNRNSIDGREMSIWTLLDYVKSNNGIPVHFIGVSTKKGRW